MVPIDLSPTPPGARPKRPTRPRRPREFFKRVEVIWTSEDDDILLADLLLLIPNDVKAEKIRISVEKHTSTGHPLVIVTYEQDAPNTRYKEQLRSYEERLTRYEADLATWTEQDAAWLEHKRRYDADVIRLHHEIENAFDDDERIVI